MKVKAGGREGLQRSEGLLMSEKGRTVCERKCWAKVEIVIGGRECDVRYIIGEINIKHR